MAANETTRGGSLEAPRTGVPRPEAPDGRRLLLTLASLIIVIAGLRAAAPLLVPFLLSVFLAILSLPLMQCLTRRRVPAALAALAAVLINLLVLSAIVAMVAGSFRDFTEAAPRYQARLAEFGHAVAAWLEGRGIDTAGWVPTDMIDPGAVLELVGVLLRSMAAVLSNAALVFLTMVFILFEASGFGGKARAALGTRHGAFEQFDRVRDDVQRYLGIKTLVSLATGLIIWGSLALLGVDFPILWGLVAFILNYIPNLGSILAAIPPVLLSLVQLGVGHAIAVAVVYLIVNMVLGNVLEPILMGRSFGLSTFVTFMSLIFWGWVWGPVGMLLSVPLTMIVKIVLENTASWRWLAILLEPSPPKIPPEMSGASGA